MNLFQIADQIATGKLVEQDHVARVLRAAADLAAARKLVVAAENACLQTREALRGVNELHTFRAPQYRSAQANVRAADARMTHAKLRFAEAQAHFDKIVGG